LFLFSELMIGIDISDRSIKVVQLSNDKGARRLLSYCWRGIEEGVIERGVIKEPNGMKEVLVDTLKQCRLTTNVDDAVVASIPEAQSFLRVIEVPEMADDETDEAVQWEVAQHIPFGLENVYIDWQPIISGHKAAPKRREVLVGAAQKKVIDPLLEVLQGLELDVAGLELESQGIVRALISSELRDRQGLLIVDLGGTATNVIIHDHGAMRFTASLQHGALRMSELLAQEDRKLLATPRDEELPKETSDRIASVIKPAQEELVMEVRGIVEFYNGIDAQHEVKEVLLTGGGSNYPGLDQVVVRLFDEIHVQRGNPWVNILPEDKAKKMPLNLRESVHFTTALGLALRSDEG
jgi:type IV pilus assembly protein PilM